MEQFKSIDIVKGRHAVALAKSEWGGLQSLKSAFSDLVSDPERSCKTLGQWYVVSIEHQQEDLARGQLAGRGLVPYLPLVPNRERHGRGSFRTVWRPMLGRYMLVKCLPSQWGMVRSARGVRRFLGMNGHPQTVDDDHLEVIRLVEAEKANDERQRAIAEDVAAKAKAGGRSGIVWHFAEGDRVRIKTGPFAGFYAELTDAVDVRDRIRAFVSLFGRQSLVELSAFEIEKAI